jgi:phage terminase large subunit-like protein
LQQTRELRYQEKLNPLLFFKHLPLQEKFHNDPAKTKAVFGGNRSGKTEELTEYMLRRIRVKPRQRWWACAETFADSVNIQQRKVWELVPKNEIQYGYYNEITGFPNRKLLLKDGQLIVFKSYDQGVESFASDDVDGIWNDEEPPIEIVKEQRMRLLDRDGEMIFSMTSVKGVTELISEVFEEADILESQYSPIVDETLPRIAEKNGMRFYFLWTAENPYINQERVAHEAKYMSRDEKKCRLHGIPINLSGRIYPQFTKLIHVTRLDDMPVDPESGEYRGYNIFFILDPHDNKPWAMKWIALHKTGTAYCVDEYPNLDFDDVRNEHKTYSEYATIIREKEENLKDIFGCGVRTRILDPNFGHKTVQLAERQGGQSKTTPSEQLKKLGFKFIDGIDSVIAGHLLVREKLHYEKKGEEITVQPQYFTLENCVNSIKSLSKYAYQLQFTASGEEKSKVNPQERYKHWADLDRYFWMSNPQYSSGVNRVNDTDPGKAY